MGISNVLFWIWVGTMGLSTGIYSIYSQILEIYKRRNGYVNKGSNYFLSSYTDFKKYEGDAMSNGMAILLLTAIPVVNVIAMSSNFINISKSLENDLEGEIKSGNVYTLEELEGSLKGDTVDSYKLLKRMKKTAITRAKFLKNMQKERVYTQEALITLERLEDNIETLPQKVVGVRKLGKLVPMSNRVRPFSDYTPDEKIGLLMSELEVAFEEKAKEEGINLDDAIELLKKYNGE